MRIIEVLQLNNLTFIRLNIIFLLIGKYERLCLFDFYPDLEQEAKNFALKYGKLKTAIFTVKELASFVTMRYKEIEPMHNLKENELIRSEWS